jgi:hypothetical protein
MHQSVGRAAWCELKAGQDATSGLNSGGVVGELLTNRPFNAIANPAHKAGIAPARNIWRGRSPMDSIIPPINGPTIEPMRPIPNAHPTPVDRMEVG